MTDIVDQTQVAHPTIEPAVLADLRSQLDAERQHLLDQLGVTEDAVDPEDPTMGHDAVSTTLGSMSREALDHVTAALARMDAGTYGACLDCGVAIPVERLEVMPAARFCVGCQQRNE